MKRALGIMAASKQDLNDLEKQWETEMRITQERIVKDVIGNIKSQVERIAKVEVEAMKVVVDAVIDDFTEKMTI